MGAVSWGFQPSSLNSSDHMEWPVAETEAANSQANSMGLCAWSLTWRHQTGRGIFGARLKSQNNLKRNILTQLRARYCGREKIKVKSQWLHNFFLKRYLYLVYIYIYSEYNPSILLTIFMSQECMGYKFHDLSQLILPMFQLKTKSREVTY